MCGIVGVVTGKLGSNLLNSYLLDAIRVGVVRGEDSTGMFQVDKDKTTVWQHKVAVAGGLFADFRETRNIIADVSSTLLTIGHHRAATAGTVTNNNAHPFSHERQDGTTLIGVHNGVLNGWRAHDNSKYHNVDSDWAMWELADKGLKAYEKFEGHYAFVYYDTNDGLLRVGCNDGRTLHYAFTKGTGAMLLASEAKMLDWLADRNNLAIEDIVRFKADKLYTIDPEHPRNFEVDDIPKRVYGNTKHVPTTVVTPATKEWWDKNLKPDEETQDVVVKLKAEEQAKAKALGIKGTEVEFRIIQIDTELGLVRGEALIPVVHADKAGTLLVGEPYEAVIRKYNLSDPETRNKLKGVGKLRCRIMGAFEHTWSGGTPEIHLVLSRPHMFIPRVEEIESYDVHNYSTD